MHLEATDADYQTPTTRTTKIILIVSSVISSSDIKFKVWSSANTDDVPAGSPEYDFSSPALDSLESQTTSIMTGFGTESYINVELESVSAGSITNVDGWAIEIPA